MYWASDENEGWCELHSRCFAAEHNPVTGQRLAHQLSYESLCDSPGVVANEKKEKKIEKINNLFSEYFSHHNTEGRERKNYRLQHSTQ